MIELTCNECEKKYNVASRRRNSKYCSRECYHEASKGRVAWNAGKKLSNEHKRNISLACMGRVPWNKGRPCSEETKKKIGLGNEVNYICLIKDGVLEKIVIKPIVADTKTKFSFKKGFSSMISLNR